jgi:hypothetical protein
VIVNFPTSLYDTVLPRTPGDVGNVTFTVSGGPPPRANQVFPQLPSAVKELTHAPRVIPQKTRRAAVGELAYTTTTGTGIAIGTGMRQFHVGQVLDFDVGTPPKLAPMKVGDDTVIQHDTNILDFTGLELSSEDQVVLNDATWQAFTVLQKRLNDLRTQRQDLETQVDGAQRRLNEADKTVAAVKVAITATTDPTTLAQLREILERVTAQAAALTIQREALVTQANTVAQQAITVSDQLSQVSRTVN